MKSRLLRTFLFAASAALLLLESGCSAEARRNRHLSRAREFQAAGELDKAEIEYINVLQREAMNGDAIAGLGQIYFDQGRVGRVYTYLIKAKELQPDNLDVRNKLGTVYFRGGRPKDAREEALYVLGKQPGNPEATVLLAEASTDQAQVEDARTRLKALPATNPEQPHVLVALAILDLKQRNPRSAEELLKRALALDPKSTFVHLGFATLHLSRRDTAKTRESLAAAAKHAPARAHTRIQHARYEMETGQFHAARAAVDEVIKLAPDCLPAHLLLAELCAVEKKYDEALGHVGKVLAREPVHPDAITLSARLYITKGEPTKAIEQLEQAVKIYPQAAHLYNQLGLACANAGDLARAAIVLGEALRLQPDFPIATMLLADVYTRQGNLVAAVTTLKQLVQKHPEMSEPRFALATAYTRQGNLDLALSTYIEIERRFPRNPMTPLYAGLVYARQKRLDDARAAFDRSLQLAPDSMAALEQVANLDMQEGKFADALERVRKAAERLPNSADPQLLLAKVLIAQGKTSEAEPVLQKLVSAHPDEVLPYVMLARLYIASGQQQKAIEKLDHVSKAKPKDPEPLMMIAVLHDQQKDYPAARAAYEKLLQLSPRSAAALNNLAYLYSTRFNETDKAFELAEKARALRPHDPEIADTLGWILYQRKQYAWAATLLQESADRNSRDPEVHYHLGMAYYMCGQEAPARAALEKALETKGDFNGKNELQPRLALLNADVARLSSAERRQLLAEIEPRSGDPIALIRSAQIHEAEGNVRTAAEKYRAALAISPEHVGSMLRLAEFARANGATSEALEHLKQARKAAPNDPAVALSLARVAFAAGDHDWAYSLLEEVVRQSGAAAEAFYEHGLTAFAIGRVADAEKSWKRFLAIESLTVRAADARQNLRLLEIAQGKSSSADDEAFVAAALKGSPQHAVGLMARATLAEARKDTSSAQAEYEKIIQAYPQLVPARIRLARIYSNQSNGTDKAYDMAIKAFSTTPDDLDLRRVLGILHFRKGEFSRAVSLLSDVSSKRAKDGEALYYQGLAYKQLSNRAASQKALREALEAELTPEMAAAARRELETQAN